MRNSKDFFSRFSEIFDNVYYFDFSSHVEINEDNYGQYLIDGIHFNDEGKKIYADCLADYIGEIQ